MIHVKGSLIEIGSKGASGNCNKMDTSDIEEKTVEFNCIQASNYNHDIYILIVL